MALPPYSSFSSFSPLPPPPPPPPQQPPPQAQSPPPPPPPPQAKKEPPPPARAEEPKPVEPKPEAPKPGVLKPEQVKAEPPRPEPARPQPAAAVAVLAPPAPVQAEPRPAPRPAAYEPVEDAAPSSNLFLAVLRRWPWMLLGLALGLVGGLLVHMKRPPVYQSAAQLLVIKNRPEMPTSAPAGDSRVAYVEDYVATQVTLIRSQKILELAARRLDQQQLSSPPPPSEAERVAFLNSRFAVARVREPGSNTPSNVLELTFRSPNPADAPKYLRAIIDAYQAELGALYEEASTKRLEVLDADLRRMANDLSKNLAEGQQLERDLLAVSPEDLAGIRTRLTANRTKLGELRLRRREIQRDLEVIARAGKTRRERLAAMDTLGLKPDQVAAAGAGQAPEELLVGLEVRRKELAQRLGPDHPEMVALDSQIKLLKDRIAQRDTVGSADDELARYQRKLEADRSAVADQIALLEADVEADEKTARAMGPLVEKLAGLALTRRGIEEAQAQARRERIQVEATSTAGGFKVQAITPPTDGAQVAPVLFQSLLLGGAVGLLLGGGLGLLAELSDRGFRSPAEIRRRLGVAVLGHIPRIRSDAPPAKRSAAGLDRLLACFYRPASREAEAVRGVRTQLYFSTQGRGHQVVQITSPGPADGKSTLAANLAISIAQSGKRVVLMDCDFRKPRVHKLFNLAHPDVGLASVMAGDARLEAAVRTCEVENLYLLPCGPRPGNPAELLTRPKFQELIEELRERYDFVVIDSPPVLAVSDPSAIAPRADGVLVVFRMSKTARPAMERTREQLDAVGARVLGVVVNASTARSSGYGGYGYSYHYPTYHDSYTPDEEPAAAVPPKG